MKLKLIFYFLRNYMRFESPEDGGIMFLRNIGFYL
jgi:hypothetical protein